MRKFLKALILVPLALLIVIFAIANREIVTFTLDPLGVTDSRLAFSLPLFALAFILVIVGVVMGGVAPWLRQSRWRRTARQLEYELRVLRGGRDALQRRAEAAEAAASPD